MIHERLLGGNLNVVQLGFFESFLLGLQDVWNQIVVVFLWLNRLVRGKKLMRQGQLMGGDESVVSSVNFVGWQSGNGLLHNRGLFNQQVVEPGC